MRTINQARVTDIAERFSAMESRLGTGKDRCAHVLCDKYPKKDWDCFHILMKYEY